MTWPVGVQLQWPVHRPTDWKEQRVKLCKSNVAKSWSSLRFLSCLHSITDVLCHLKEPLGKYYILCITPRLSSIINTFLKWSLVWNYFCKQMLASIFRGQETIRWGLSFCRLPPFISNSTQRYVSEKEVTNKQCSISLITFLWDAWLDVTRIVFVSMEAINSHKTGHLHVTSLCNNRAIHPRCGPCHVVLMTSFGTFAFGVGTEVIRVWSHSITFFPIYPSTRLSCQSLLPLYTVLVFSFRVQIKWKEMKQPTFT